MSTSIPTSSEPDPAKIPLPETPAALSPQENPVASVSALPPAQTSPTPNDSGPVDRSGVSTALTILPPPELVLCVFIHGFKGTDSTFGAFPHRVGHLVEQVLK
ncbi:hypothetical protein FRC12_024010, partial [Ceratobasidium sp. 428]